MNPQKDLPYFVLFSLFILGLAPTCFSQSTHSSHTALVEQITKKMALQEQLGEAPADIRTQFNQNPFQLSEEKNKSMLQMFDKAYEPALLMADFKSSLLDSMSNQNDEEIHEWLDKPSTKAVYAAQNEFYTLQGKRKRVITMYEMDQKPAPAARKKLISNFTDTTSIGNASIESSVIILRSVIEGVGELGPKRRFTKSKVDAIADNFRLQMQGQANELLNRQLLVMYYSLPVDKLKKFTSFWFTDAGQWLDNNIEKAMKSTYQSAADRFLESVRADSSH